MVAHELGINRVIFPRNAGTLSAYGMLWSDIVHDVSRSFLRRVSPEILNELSSLIAELMEEGTRLLVQDEVTVADRSHALFVDMRYLGQGFELTVPWDAVDVTPEVLAAAIDRFHELHLQRFAHNNPGEPVEIVTVRLLATGTLSKPGLQTFSPRGRQEETERRTVYVDGGWHEVPVFDRESLRPGHPVKGSVILLEGLFDDIPTARLERRGAAERRPDGARLNRGVVMDTINPVRLEIIRHALTVAAEEMSVAVRLTSRSTVVRELLDYSTAIFDARGRNVAQSARVPIHLNTMGPMHHRYHYRTRAPERMAQRGRHCHQRSLLRCPASA